MSAAVLSLPSRPARKALGTHARTTRDVHLRTLFDCDQARGERLTVEFGGHHETPVE